MKLVTGRSDVLATLQRLRAAGTALFSPNGELAAEIEGLLIGAQRFADSHGLAEVPIAIGMTGIYPDNAQFRKISTSCVTRTDLGGFDGGDVREGCEIWLRTLAVYDSLAGADGRPPTQRTRRCSTIRRWSSGWRSSCTTPRSSKRRRTSA